VRGQRRTNPLLLIVQMGPGFPTINEAGWFRGRLRLEDDFVVAYWDQRACGKSFNSRIPPESMTLERMTDDTLEVLEVLCRHVDAERAYVLGFSLGGTVATLAAAQDARRVRSLVTVGVDVDFDTADPTGNEVVERGHQERPHEAETGIENRQNDHGSGTEEHA